MAIKPVDIIQRFLTFESIGASTLRNQGVGVVAATREYLANINLERVPKKNHAKFRKWLDFHTEGILDNLPIKNRPWGTARKGLNLFLRSALYNHYIREEYDIGAVESFLEIPLDSVVAIALKRRAGRGQLPQWTGLKNLTPEISKIFQDYALYHSIEMKLPARVFLDNYLWLNR